MSKFQELELKGKRFNQLHWLRYQVINIYKNGTRQYSDIDVSSSANFPPLYFSRVQSYANHSDLPLQWKTAWVPTSTHTARHLIQEVAVHVSLEVTVSLNCRGERLQNWLLDYSLLLILLCIRGHAKRVEMAINWHNFFLLSPRVARVEKQEFGAKIAQSWRKGGWQSHITEDTNLSSVIFTSSLHQCYYSGWFHYCSQMFDISYKRYWP